MNLLLDLVSQYLSNDAGGGHNVIYGANKGSVAVKYMGSGRAGTVLRSLEQPLLRRMPPDFFCMIRYWVSGDTVVPELKTSQTASEIWPTFFEYRYDFQDQIYKRVQTYNQIDDPFEGFLQLGN